MIIKLFSNWPAQKFYNPSIINYNRYRYALWKIWEQEKRMKRRKKLEQVATNAHTTPANNIFKKEQQEKYMCTKATFTVHTSHAIKYFGPVPVIFVIVSRPHSFLWKFSFPLPLFFFCFHFIDIIIRLSEKKKYDTKKSQDHFITTNRNEMVSGAPHDNTKTHVLRYLIPYTYSQNPENRTRPTKKKAYRVWSEPKPSI